MCEQKSPAIISQPFLLLLFLLCVDNDATFSKDLAYDEYVLGVGGGGGGCGGGGGGGGAAAVVNILSTAFYLRSVVSRLR